MALCLLQAPAAQGHQEIEVLVAELDRRIQEEPANAALHLRRGELHRLHGEYAAALQDYRRARELDPHLSVVDLCLGKVLLEAGLWLPARVALDRFLVDVPRHAEGLAARARAQRGLGDPAGAAEDFARAMEAVAPPRLPAPELYLERAQALAALGPLRVDEALGVLDQGLARLGQPVTLALYAIQLEVEQARYPQALSRLEEAARRSPRQESWLVRRGQVLEEAGRAEEARAAYRQALAAIEGLPASRRKTPAVARLAAQARARVERPPAQEEKR